MIDWKWENFVEVLSDGTFNIDNAGPLRCPIENFKIYRDGNLQIWLETVCQGTGSTTRPQYPPGTVRVNEDFVEMARGLGIPVRARANGVLPISSRITNDGVSTEKSAVSEILITLREGVEGCLVIDWLTNLDDRFYLWPDMNESRLTEASEQLLKSGDVSIKATATNTAESFSRNCIFLTVGSSRLFLGRTQDVGIDPSFMPGYILYEGVPTEDERKRIRLSLSFALGRPLVYMGHSIFDNDWKSVSTQALSPNTIDGKVFELPTVPPAPLSKRGINELGSQDVSDFANAFYRCFDAYDLEYVSWLYWHSVAAPAHMAPLSFGATLEAIQQEYIRNKGDAFETRLLENTTWSAISERIIEILDKSTADNQNSEFRRRIEILKKRVNSNLNQAPQTELTKRFLDSLNIRFSEKEKNAWKQRNIAAHGSKTEAHKYIDLIKDAKLLRVLCNRVLLALTGASDQYIDYYSINLPVRNLEEAIE